MVSNKSILLFDVDGTLTKARNPIDNDMDSYLNELSKKFTLAAIGGSDFSKIKEQLGKSIIYFTYVFSENGLVSYKENELFHVKKINEYLGEERQKEFINYLLRYLAELKIPKKRGTFIEYRTGMFNVSPIGRNCSQQEREEFHEYNKEAKVLEKMREDVEKEFGEKFGLVFSIGGQISFDCVPKGWDKSYCLQFVQDKFENIYFFGDKIYMGGNDYEIAIDKRVKESFTTTGPANTIELLNSLINKINN